MNDDYLWDKTGEPDPQVQELEEILGSLRYQPKPLQIPNEPRLPQRRNYFPWLAIAAGVLLAILAGGIWLSTRSRGDSTLRQAEVKPPTPVEEVTPVVPKTPERRNESPE